MPSSVQAEASYAGHLAIYLNIQLARELVIVLDIPLTHVSSLVKIGCILTGKFTLIGVGLSGGGWGKWK